MLKTLTATAVACMVLPFAAALANADPAPDTAALDAAAPAPNAAVPPPPDGAVPSSETSLLTTPEGWTLAAFARDETQVAVNPLTTALSSREYLVGATFAGAITGKGSTTLGGGTFDVGYQIGCGIGLDKVKLSGSIGYNASGPMLSQGNFAAPTGHGFAIQGNIEVSLRAGEVLNVAVLKKEFKGTTTRVTIHDIHVKIDGCVGQSFLRSYAILTSKTDVTDDVVAYYGVTKTV